MEDNIQNVKCLIFRNSIDRNIFKIIKFKTREVAKQYYKVALRKETFVHADVLEECIKWCKTRNFTYEIIERDKYIYTD